MSTAWSVAAAAPPQCLHRSPLPRPGSPSNPSTERDGRTEAGHMRGLNLGMLLGLEVVVEDAEAAQGHLPHHIATLMPRPKCGDTGVEFMTILRAVGHAVQQSGFIEHWNSGHKKPRRSGVDYRGGYFFPNRGDVSRCLRAVAAAIWLAVRLAGRAKLFVWFTTTLPRAPVPPESLAARLCAMSFSNASRRALVLAVVTRSPFSRSQVPVFGTESIPSWAIPVMPMLPIAAA